MNHPVIHSFMHFPKNWSSLLRHTSNIPLHSVEFGAGCAMCVNFVYQYSRP